MSVWTSSLAAVVAVAALASAPIAHAEPSDSGTGSSGSAGSARSGTSSSSKPNAASEAKAWQNLEDTTKKALDDLTNSEQQTLASRMAQAQDDQIADLQDRFGTLQQLSSARNTLELEMSDAADEAAVLDALKTGDTTGARARVEQDAKDRQALLDERRASANSLPDQTGGIGQYLNSLGAMQSLQQYDADQTKAILDAKEQAQTDPEVQAQLMQQMMDIQKEIRDKMAAIQADQVSAMQQIARTI